MNLNSIFFPAPRCSYNAQTLKNELIWIPKFKNGIDNSSEHYNTKLLTDYDVKIDHFDNDITSLLTNYNKSYNGVSNSKKIKIFTKSTSSEKFDPPFFTSPTKIKNKMIVSNVVNPIILNSPLSTPRLSESFSSDISLTDCKDDLGIIQDESKNFNINNTLHKKNKPKFHEKTSILQTEWKSPKSNDASLILEEGIFPINPHKEFKFFKTNLKNSRSAGKLKDFESTNIFVQNDNSDHIPIPKSCRKSIDTKSFKSSSIDYTSIGSEKKIFSENKHSFKINLSKITGSTQRNKTTSKKPIDIQLVSTNYKKVMFEANNENDSNFDILSPKKISISDISTKNQPEYYIPCLLLKSMVHTKKIIIYFHGNGEDIYLSYDLLNHLRNSLNVFSFKKKMF